MAYNHGVRVKEQATSLVAPVTGTAGLQVIIGTAPVNLAADPYKATNVPMIAYSFSEAVEQVGYSDDFKNYTLCQSMDACFRVLNVAPIILINVLDPKKHKKANEEQTVNVEKMQTTVKVAGILADTVEVKANEATLTAGTDYITTFDDDGYLVITLTAGGKGASAKTLTVNSTKVDDLVVVACFSNGTVSGVILGPVYNSANTPHEGGAGIFRQEMSNNVNEAVMSYSEKKQTIILRAPKIEFEGYGYEDKPYVTLEQINDAFSDIDDNKTGISNLQDDTAKTKGKPSLQAQLDALEKRVKALGG